MVKSYDPKAVALIVGGTIINGFTDGTFIVAERNEQAWNLKVGVDGEGTRAKNNNLSGKITITLHQSSNSNDYLSGLALEDQLAGTGAVPISLRDQSGRTVMAALTGWVQKYANAEFGKEVANRVWIIETDELDIADIGGN